MSARVLVAAAPDEDPLPGGLIVAHFRLDPSPRVIAALSWGALIIVLGSLVIGTGLVWSRTSDDRPMHARARRMASSRGSLVGSPVDAQGRPLDHGDALLLEAFLGTVGLASIVLGAGVSIFKLERELRREAYMVLRTDGVLYRDEEGCSGVLWEDIEGVRWDGESVCFDFHDGSVWRRPERYGGVDGPTLAREAATVRRKALFGLYG